MLIFYFETRALCNDFFLYYMKNKFQEHYDTCDKKLSKHIKVHWKPNNFSFHNTDAQMQSSLVFTIKNFPQLHQYAVILMPCLLGTWLTCIFSLPSVSLWTEVLVF